MFFSSLRKKQILPLATAVNDTSVVNELTYFNLRSTRAFIRCRICCLPGSYPET
jgi:hypothetical protein